MYKINSNINIEKIEGRNCAFTIYNFSTKNKKITLSFKAIETLNKNDLFIDDFSKFHSYKNNLTHYISDITFEKKYCEEDILELCIDNSICYKTLYTYCLNKLELLKKKVLALNEKQYFEFRQLIEKMTTNFNLNKHQEKIIVLENKLDSEITADYGLNPPFYSIVSYFSKKQALKELCCCSWRSKCAFELYKKK